MVLAASTVALSTSLHPAHRRALTYSTLGATMLSALWIASLISMLIASLIR